MLTKKNSVFKILDYLANPPSHEELSQLLKKLNLTARELIRKKDSLYKELFLGDLSKTDQELIQAMVEHPKLIERPIFVVGDKARIGRPPEQVLDLLH